MNGYVGTAEDKRRIVRQQKEREQQLKAFEDAKRAVEDKNTAALRQFGASTTEVADAAFKNATVGLTSREEFAKTKATIAEVVAQEEKRKREDAEETAWAEKQKQRAVKRAKAEQRLKLSFADDDDEEQDDENDRRDDDGKGTLKQPDRHKSDLDLNNYNDDNGTNHPQQQKRKFATLGKDPTVTTAFLPDKDRDCQEEELRQQLAKEWELQQAAIKSEPLEITYSYYNGTGHRRKIQVCKGDSISQFLKSVQEQLREEFREMRTTSVGSMMYVKEDIILPHTVTFYDLIVNKAQGRSGPLFQFDVSEHAVAAFDPRMKSKDTHAGKVVDRHWYEKHKHIFPYNKWEVYDETKRAPA
jgi:protein FAM50